MEAFIFLALFLWLAGSIIEGRIVFVNTTLNIPIAIFIVLSLMQFLIGRITSSRLGTIYPYVTRVYSFEILSFMAAFMLIVNNIHTRRQVNRFLFSIISVGAILSLFGIIQKLAGATRIFWIRDVPEVANFYSTYINCNYFAGYMNMVIFLSLGAFFAYLAYLDKKRGFYRFDIFEGWNSLFVFSIVIMIASLFHTFAQGGIVAFSITAAFFSYIFLKKALPKKRILILTLASAVLLTIAALYFIRRSYFYDLLNTFANPNTYILRMLVWSKTLNLVKRNPILGIGLGTFVHIFPRYRPNYPFLFKHCYNDYLELLAETGFIGFSVFLFGMALFFKRYMTLLNSRHDPYAQRVGHGCLASAFSIFIYSFLDSNMHKGANALLFSFILAVGIVVIHNHLNTDRKETLLFKTTVYTINNRSEKMRLFLILAIAFLYIMGNIVSIATANIYALIGERQKNMDYIKKAVKLEPSSAEYHGLLADAVLKDYTTGLRKSEMIETSIDELKESIKLNPNASSYHRKLGWVYSYNGGKEKAVEELKKAQDSEPLDAFNYIILAIYYFNEATKIEGVNPYGSRAMENGVAEYRKALTIDPSANLERYKNYLRDYPRIMETLKRYEGIQT